MTPERRAALVDAIGDVQMIAVILQALGAYDASVDASAVEWLGKHLEAAYEAAACALPARSEAV